MTRARERLLKLRAMHATMARRGGGTAILTIHPFPSEGSAVYDGLMAAWSEALGTERERALLAMGADQLEEGLDGIGTATEQITFSDHGVDQPARFTVSRKIDLTSALRDGSIGSRIIIYKDRFDDRDALQAKYGPIAEMLPSDF